MICIYITAKLHSKGLHFSRHFYTIIQNWTFFYNMVSLTIKRSNYLTHQLLLYSDEQDLT